MALAGQPDVEFLVAMTENCNSQPATAAELPDWQSELNFDAVLMTDPGRDVYTDYAVANNCMSGGGVGGPGCSNAVSVIIDKQMVIRHFGTTYECGRGEGSCGSTPEIPDETAECLDQTLNLMLDLLAE